MEHIIKGKGDEKKKKKKIDRKREPGFEPYFHSYKVPDDNFVFLFTILSIFTFYNTKFYFS